jgi:hypothetical protein
MGCSNNIKVDESTNSKNATVAVVKANKKTIQNQNAELIQKQQEIKNISNANTQNIIQKEVNIPKSIQQNVTQNIPKTNQKTISKEEMINYKNLPNYDLFEKFINMEKVKQYLDENISQGYDQIIDGIFNDIKPLITELFKRFKIEYEIISQKKVIDCRSYQVVITPPQGTQNLDNYFPLFFMNFWFYPPEVFNRRIIKKFYFCEQLMFATSTYSQPRAACPEWSQTHSMIYAMEYQSNQYLAEVMHHELFHYLDFMISGSKVDSKVQADWETLNPKGFHYGSGGQYEREYVNINKKDQMYFVSHYSMTDCCEDRAEAYCRLMTRNSNWHNEQSQVIEKKIEKLRNFMKILDPTYIGNNNNYYYERLQKFLDTDFNIKYNS